MSNHCLIMFVFLLCSNHFSVCVGIFVKVSAGLNIWWLYLLKFKFILWFLWYFSICYNFILIQEWFDLQLIWFNDWWSVINFFINFIVFVFNVNMFIIIKFSLLIYILMKLISNIQWQIQTLRLLIFLLKSFIDIYMIINLSLFIDNSIQLISDNLCLFVSW